MVTNFASRVDSISTRLFDRDDGGYVIVVQLFHMIHHLGAHGAICPNCAEVAMFKRLHGTSRKDAVVQVLHDSTKLPPLCIDLIRQYCLTVFRGQVLHTVDGLVLSRPMARYSQIAVSIEWGCVAIITREALLLFNLESGEAQEDLTERIETATRADIKFLFSIIFSGDYLHCVMTNGSLFHPRLETYGMHMVTGEVERTDDVSINMFRYNRVERASGEENCRFNIETNVLIREDAEGQSALAKAKIPLPSLHRFLIGYYKECILVGCATPNLHVYVLDKESMEVIDIVRVKAYVEYYKHTILTDPEGVVIFYSEPKHQLKIIR